MKALTLAIFTATSTLVGVAASAQADSISDVLLARTAVEQNTATDRQKDLVSRYGG